MTACAALCRRYAMCGPSPARRDGPSGSRRTGSASFVLQSVCKAQAAAPPPSIAPPPPTGVPMSARRVEAKLQETSPLPEAHRCEGPAPQSRTQLRPFARRSRSRQHPLVGPYTRDDCGIPGRRSRSVLASNEGCERATRPREHRHHTRYLQPRQRGDAAGRRGDRRGDVHRARALAAEAPAKPPPRLLARLPSFVDAAIPRALSGVWPR
jgi:hypothetical protein